MAQGPPDSVLAAFGTGGASPVQLQGGAGAAWRVGHLVLKPEREQDDAIAWMVASVEAVPDSGDFRMARHVPAGDGRFVVDGWAATGWIEAAHVSERWSERLAASRAFHAAIAGVPSPPSDLQWAETAWRVADRVAWNEASFDAPGEVREVLDRVAPVTAGSWRGAPPQVVHADIGGNVLFADDAPPAIIDLSLYARPPEYPNAVAVADFIAWEGAPLTHAIRFSATVADGDQLLARAVIFRLVTAAIAFAGYPDRVAAEVGAYAPVLSAIRTN